MAGEINKRINQLTTQLQSEKLAQAAYKYFRDITPIARVNGGNARRNTHLVRDTIQADYRYAQRLDAGYSGQAPAGMTKPTEQFIKDWIAKNGKG
jgi:hypothetical protein